MCVDIQIILGRVQDGHRSLKKVSVHASSKLAVPALVAGTLSIASTGAGTADKGTVQVYMQVSPHISTNLSTDI